MPLRNKPIFVEFFGLPGSGKSTVANELFLSLQKKNHSVLMFWDEYMNIRKNKILSISFILKTLIFRPTFCFHLFRKSGLNFSRVKEALHFLLIFGYINSSIFQKKTKNYDFVLLDQGLIQCVAVMQLPSNNSVDNEFLNFLMKNLDLNFKLFYFSCSCQLSFERLRERFGGNSRFDFWNDQKVLSNLEVMKNIFEYISENKKDVLIIDAKGGVNKKVQHLIDIIYLHQIS